MPECDACGIEFDESAAFCPNCGEPQDPNTKRKVIIGRVSYAIGFLFIVIGISLLPGNLGGVPMILGGIQLFPPSRQLLGRVFGRPPKIWANAAFSLVLVLIGVVVYFLL